MALLFRRVAAPSLVDSTVKHCFTMSSAGTNNWHQQPSTLAHILLHNLLHHGRQRFRNP